MLRKTFYVVEAIPIYCLMGLLRLVPLTLASGGAGALARAFGPYLPITRHARANLELAFPGMSTAEKRRIIREMWDNLGRMFGEAARVGDLWDESLIEAAQEHGATGLVAAARENRPVAVRGRNIEIEGVEHFTRLLYHRGPAIIFTGHFGNWELLPVGAANFGVYSAVIFRTPNNPYVARLIERLRRGLVRLLPKGLEGAVAAGRVLEQGGRLGFLADQKQNRGIPVPFFGKDAMTGTTLAKLAIRFQCPVYGAWVERIGGRRFRIHVEAPVEYALTGDEDRDIREITGKVNDTIEGWVRRRPGQWLWLHRRWPRDAVKAAKG